MALNAFYHRQISYILKRLEEIHRLADIHSIVLHFKFKVAIPNCTYYIENIEYWSAVSMLEVINEKSTLSKALCQNASQQQNGLVFAWQRI